MGLASATVAAPETCCGPALDDLFARMTNLRTPDHLLRADIAAAVYVASVANVLAATVAVTVAEIESGSVVDAVGAALCPTCVVDAAA